MRKSLYRFLVMTLAAVGLTTVSSCGDNGPDGPKGYSADVALDRVEYVNVTMLNSTTHLIDLTLSNGAYQLTLNIGSEADDLDAGEYKYAAWSSLAKGLAAMDLSVYNKNYKIDAPTLTVTRQGDSHKIVFEATVNQGDRIRLTYEGKIAFRPEVGPDGLLLRDQVLPSQLMGCNMLYTIYLPPSWDGKKTFPVLYLLHGATNFGATGHNDWVDGAYFDVKLAAMIKQGKACEMVVIMPNCCVAGENLFYCDSYQGGKYPYMSFFFNELVPTLEAKYRIASDREHRVVSGLSMGGYGSLYYGALHPEMFSYVYACSPATWLDGAPNIIELLQADQAAGAKLPGITIEIGTSDFLYGAAEMFVAYLKAMGIDHEYITRDGAHDWTFWDVCAPKIITRATEVFTK